MVGCVGVCGGVCGGTFLINGLLKDIWEPWQVSSMSVTGAAG